MTRYDRTFWIQASHFNGARTYELWRTAYKDSNFDALLGVLNDCHGHNFKVELTGWADLDAQGFVFEDEVAEELVRRWDNCNLSILDEFGRGLGSRRVSLEWMCERLAIKLAIKFEHVVRWRVTIHETNCIRATYETRGGMPAEVNP